MPYAMTMSGSSVMTALAAAFMRSSARRSFGFSNAYLFENLARIRIRIHFHRCRKKVYLWKPLPSMRTTIQVFGSRRSGCSNAFTYSYLQLISKDRPGHRIKTFTWSLPSWKLLLWMLMDWVRHEIWRWMRPRLRQFRTGNTTNRSFYVDFVVQFDILSQSRHDFFEGLEEVPQLACISESLRLWSHESREYNHTWFSPFKALQLVWNL